MLVEKSLFSHQYLELLSRFGFENLIDTCTWVIQKSSTCIDHIRIEKESRIISAVVNTNITDHRVIVMSFS